VEEITHLFPVAQKVTEFCRERGWKFCFIGGLALQRWGEPRKTIDVDLTLLTGFGKEEAFVDALLSEFTSRRNDGRDFALRYRVLLLHIGNVGVDIALGALPFEEHTIARSSDYVLNNGFRIPTCSAEDLIIHKAFANRLQDWADIQNVLIKQHGKLDFELILRELTPLVSLKEEPDILNQLERLRKEADRRVLNAKRQSAS